MGLKYFPESTGKAFNDGRLKLFFDDAAKYLRMEGKGQNYDAIICGWLSYVYMCVHVHPSSKCMCDHPPYILRLVDSSDPVGPAATLYTPEFYQSMSDALSPEGVICTQVRLTLVVHSLGDLLSVYPSQGECQWLHVDFIKEVMERSREIFPKVQYAYSSVPSYPSGQLGFIVAAKNKDCELSGEITYRVVS